MVVDEVDGALNTRCVYNIYIVIYIQYSHYKVDAMVNFIQNPEIVMAH
jgi:hypothetical protein